MMLGHIELSTTQPRTQVSIRKLQEIHSATHPSAEIERRRRRSEQPREKGTPTVDDPMAAPADEAAEEDGAAPVAAGEDER